jgi:hypothetical protein
MMACESQGNLMNRVLRIGVLIASMLPLYAGAQQPDAAKLKSDAQQVVSIISGDKSKTQTFCQMGILGKEINEAIQEKDTKKASDLAQRISEGEKQLGPEYLALVDALREIDLNSKDGQEILSIFDKLDNYCPH